MGALGSGLILLLALGAPIGVALGGAAVAFILYDPVLSANTAFRAFFSFVNKYTLMAIPFFIYAGFLMERTGLISKLFKFADAIIGWLPGGFAYATLIAAVLFGAISGSSTAMAAAMGVIAYPEMIRRGYPVWMAAGVIACGGGIAILIPPSITLILFGIITEESIVKLFFAGFVPGILLAVSDAVIIVFIAWKLKLPAGEFSFGQPLAFHRRGAAGDPDAGLRAGRALRRRVHADRGGRGLLRLCADLRLGGPARRVPARAAADDHARGQPHRHRLLPASAASASSSSCSPTRAGRRMSPTGWGCRASPPWASSSCCWPCCWSCPCS